MAFLPDLIVLDTETTGLSREHDEPIEVAALRVAGDAVADVFHTLVRPARPVHPSARRIHGIGDEDLRTAPTPAAAGRSLAAFLGDLPIVSHNAPFDETMVQKLPGVGARPFLDSLDIITLLHPELPSHALGALAQTFAVEVSAAHRAEGDARTLLRVLLALLGRLRDNGRRRDLEALGTIFRGSDWPWLPVVQRLLDTWPADAADPPPPATDAAEGGPPPSSAPRDVPPLDAILGPEGALARQLPGFRARHGQLAMARAVEEAFARGRIRAIEAPTGTGKSLAYLIPAARIATPSARVLVCTNTRILQDQLALRDGPLVRDAVRPPLRLAVLKGRDNYLCGRRLRRLLDDEPDLTASLDERRARAFLHIFAARVPDGDLERINERMLRNAALRELRDRVRSTPEACGRFCSAADGCCFRRALVRAGESDILIVNHALAAAWPESYPTFAHVVFDEAHLLEDAFTSAATLELDSRQLSRRLRTFIGNHGPAHGLRRALRPEGGGSGRRRKTLPETIASRIAAAQGEIRRTLESLDAITDGLPASRDNDGYPAEMPLPPGWMSAPPFRKVAPCLRDLLDSLRKLGVLARSMEAEVEATPSLPDRNGWLDETGELATIAGDAALALEAVAGEGAGDAVNLLRQSARDRDDWSFGSAPLGVAGFVRRLIDAASGGVIFTSATLGAPGAPDWVESRLGLAPAADARVDPLLTIPSPFPPDAAAAVVISDLVDAGETGPSPARMTDLVAAAARTLGGRTLVLFSSLRRRDQVGARLRHVLADDGIDVLIQGEGSTERMIDALRKDERAVLLGTRLLAQGVDIPGRGLSLVIVERVPFERPTAVIHAARSEALGPGRGFYAYSLPEALIRLRQAIGRLIRSETDRGVVLLADSRCLTRSWGQEVRATLSAAGPAVLPLRELPEFLLKRGLAREEPAS